METNAQRNYRHGYDAGHSAGWHKVVNNVTPDRIPSDETVWGDGWLEGYAAGKSDAEIYLANEDV